MSEKRYCPDCDILQQENQELKELLEKIYDAYYDPTDDFDFIAKEDNFKALIDKIKE